MTKFTKYSSIENSYRKKYINDIVEAGLSDGLWIVTTKIHGANFSFVFTYEKGKDVTVQCAKRTGFVGGDNFFGYQKLLTKFKDQIDNTIQRVKDVAELEKYDYLQVTIYGEIFGGVYPHKDVPRLNAAAVQKEVFYSNDTEFLAFDERVEYRKEGDEEICGEWIHPKQYIKTLAGLGWPIVPVLEICSFEKALEYPNLFEDPIHKLYGLPTIENNPCEGVVIKPFDSVKYLHNSGRVIIKNKNEKFSEKKAVHIPKFKPEESEQDIADKASVAEFINEARLRNVLSKIGTVEKGDFRKIQSAFVEDAREDYFKDKDPNFAGPIFGKYASRLCGELIRKNFLNITDGNF